METKSIKTAFTIEGMSCTNCALGIMKQLEKTGVSDVSVDFATRECSFTADDENLIKTAINRVESLGYKVVIANKDTEEEGNNEEKWDVRMKFYFSLVFTLPLLVAMFIPISIFHNPYFQLILTIPVFLTGLQYFGRSAYYSAKSGIPNMDVLITLGATAAFIYSIIGTVSGLGHDYLFYETTASIFTLVLLGNYIEDIAIKKNTSAIDDLCRLQNVKARKITTGNDGKEIISEINAEDIKLNDTLLINSGDNIPVDGIVLSGYASVDESMLSGESIPVEKNQNEKLTGGTIITNGSIRMTATAIGKDTVLSQIIELVKSAQKEKSPVQNLADKISAVFVPVVIGISILTFVLSYYVFSVDFRESLLRSIAVLVIACPCAMGLAIPTAVVVGVSRVARHGILIKGASVIQQLTEIKTFAFDKTGTLTTGDFNITRIEPVGRTEQDIKRILYNLEKYSSHPIARSITEGLKGTQEMEIINPLEIKGGGVVGTDKDNNKIIAGSYEFAKDLTDDNKHSIYVIENNVLVGFVDIEDMIKPEAKEVISYLKLKKIKPVIISGDSEAKCTYVAGELNIDEYYFGKKPTEKLGIIERLAKEDSVVMVGDGINDAPALTSATLGISMSNASQIAIKSAGIILLNGNLNLLRNAISISGITMKVIKQNLFWAFFYNIIAIPIAASGLLNPMVAAAAMAFSDLFVIGNSLRLRYIKLD